MTPVSTERQAANHRMAQLWAQLREDILSGQILPGARLPTQRQLSSKYGVAPATASVAMTRLAHEGLVVRTPGRGSFVADQLPAQHQILDFVRLQSPVDKRKTGWVLDWVEGLSRAANQHGWTGRWHHLTDNETAKLGELVEKLSSSKGVITFYLIPVEFPWLLYQRRVPVVTIHATRGGRGLRPQCYPQISYDREQSARMAMEHLISVGYSRIGYVGGASGSQERIAGFVDVARRHKMTIQAEWLVQFDWSIKDLNRLQGQVRRFFKAQNCPEAFCCESRDVALAVRSVAGDLGLKIPEDLALVACDCGDPEIPGDIGITTVAVSISETCQEAINALEQVRAERNTDHSRLWEPVMMPLHLHVKDSCGAKLRGVDIKEIGG